MTSWNEPVPVAHDHEIVIKVALEPDIPLLGPNFHHAHDVFRNLTQRHRFHFLIFLALETADFKKFIDQPFQALGLIINEFPIFLYHPDL